LPKLKDSEFPPSVSFLVSTELTKGGESHIYEQEVPICSLLPPSAEISSNEKLFMGKLEEGRESPKGGKGIT